MCGLCTATQQENCTEVLCRWEAETLSMQKQSEYISGKTVLVETINKVVQNSGSRGNDK